jgi:hypothetical protein
MAHRSVGSVDAQVRKLPVCDHFLVHATIGRTALAQQDRADAQA